LIRSDGEAAVYEHLQMRRIRVGQTDVLNLAGLLQGLQMD
jgi:hypothetical protein